MGAPVRLDGPIEVPHARVSPLGLSLAPRDALPQVDARSDWALVTLTLDAATPAWACAQALRSLTAHVITEADQIVSAARLAPRPALLREPDALDGARTWSLAVDLRATPGLRGLDEPHRLHVSAAAWRSTVQRRAPVTPDALPVDPSSLARDVDRLVVAATLSALGRDGDALPFFASALRDGPARDDLSHPHLYNAACAAARAAASTLDAAGRARLTAMAQTWLREDLQRLERRMLDTWRALAALDAGPARDHLVARRDALAAHLDLRAVDDDLTALRSEGRGC